MVKFRGFKCSNFKKIKVLFFEKRQEQKGQNYKI